MEKIFVTEPASSLAIWKSSVKLEYSLTATRHSSITGENMARAEDRFGCKEAADGRRLITRSYAWTNGSDWPPGSTNGLIDDVITDAHDVCANGWICVHQWRVVRNMVTFRNVFSRQPLGELWVLLTQICQHRKCWGKLHTSTAIITTTA